MHKKSSAATVIIVDDDASIRRALQTQLGILGFKVLVFSGAKELLAGDLPASEACLLLDIYMPEMNGVELCQILAASGRKLPTILMTGRDDQQSRQLMSDVNPIATLFKPFEEITLIRALRKALRKHPNPRH